MKPSTLNSFAANWFGLARTVQCSVITLDLTPRLSVESYLLKRMDATLQCVSFYGASRVKPHPDFLET